MKIPIQNEMPKIKHKGRLLTPLTEQEAFSLDEKDTVKFIGKTTSMVYTRVRRRVITLAEKPKYDPVSKKITLHISSYSYYDSPCTTHIGNWALVARGDKHAAKANISRRFISMNLRGFKRDVEALAKRAIQRIDGHLEDLPLHKRMELFQDIPEKEKLIYDFIYKDFEKVMGLKEEDAPSEELVV